MGCLLRGSVAPSRVPSASSTKLRTVLGAWKGNSSKRIGPLVVYMTARVASATVFSLVVDYLIAYPAIVPCAGIGCANASGRAGWQRGKYRRGTVDVQQEDTRGADASRARIELGALPAG